jgi:hypothetical protein
MEYSLSTNQSSDDFDVIDYLPDGIDDAKKPTWRWYTAMRLAETADARPAKERGRESKQKQKKKRGFDHDDVHVCQAADYLLAVRLTNEIAFSDGGLRERKRRELGKRYPYIAHAHAIYNKKGKDKHKLRRWKIEALIMARKPADEIAKSFLIATEVIETYERLFFDVRDRLDSRDYVDTTILGPAISNGMFDRDFDFLCKIFAYHYGEVALEVFFHPSMGVSTEATLANLSGLADDVIFSRSKGLAVIAAMTQRVDSYTRESIMANYMQLLALEKSKDSNNLDAHSVDGASVLIQSMHFSLAGLSQAPQVVEGRSGISPWHFTYPRRMPTRRNPRSLYSTYRGPMWRLRHWV